ncbi:hypothetical protein EDC04DRAFT_2607248 [Pisolithus marmoratus]|nr:hypothetical protein EDC04DRAFT_2607248 [Pisolithus marmoratus]
MQFMDGPGHSMKAWPQYEGNTMQLMDRPINDACPRYQAQLHNTVQLMDRPSCAMQAWVQYEGNTVQLMDRPINDACPRHQAQLHNTTQLMDGPINDACPRYQLLKLTLQFISHGKWMPSKLLELTPQFISHGKWIPCKLLELTPQFMSHGKWIPCKVSVEAWQKCGLHGGAAVGGSDWQNLGLRVAVILNGSHANKWIPCSKWMPCKVSVAAWQKCGLHGRAAVGGLDEQNLLNECHAKSVWKPGRTAAGMAELLWEVHIGRSYVYG